VDSGASNASTVWRQVATSQELRTWCLAPIWGAWHRFGCLFASIDLASHLVPGTDLSASLLASDLASHLVPGTDLSHRFVRLFASIRSGDAPGAWHRFGRTVGGPLFASIDGLGSETQTTVELLYRLPGVRGDWHRCGTPNA